jgi:hypothetical protein
MNATDLPIVKISGFLPARLKALITRNGVELCKIFWPEPTSNGNILSLIVDRKICSIEKSDATLPPTEATPDDIEHADLRIVSNKGKLDAFIRKGALRLIGKRLIVFSTENLTIEPAADGDFRAYHVRSGHFRIKKRVDVNALVGYYKMERINEKQFILRQLVCTQ